MKPLVLRNIICYLQVHDLYRDYLCAYTSPSDVHFIHYDIVNTLLYFHTAVAPFTSFPSRLVSTSAIRQSILNENSCNPVVKAAATSILSIATRQSPSRVENVRKRLAWLHMYNNCILKNCSALHMPKKKQRGKAFARVCVCVYVRVWRRVGWDTPTSCL